MSSTKQAESEKIEAQLQVFDAKIDEMRSKAAQAGAEAKVKYYEQLENLQKQRQDVGQKFEAFKTSSESAWQEVKGGLEEAMSSLQSSFDRASSHFS